MNFSYLLINVQILVTATLKGILTTLATERDRLKVIIDLEPSSSGANTQSTAGSSNTMVATLRSNLNSALQQNSGTNSHSLDVLFFEINTYICILKCKYGFISFKNACLTFFPIDNSRLFIFLYVYSLICVHMYNIKLTYNEHT